MSGKSPSSPPLMPCKYDKGEDREPTIDVYSLKDDINMGRSILNNDSSSKSLKHLFEEFELDDKKKDSNKKLKLISPSILKARPSSSCGDLEPWMPWV
jgi:hypothetical protein